MKLFSGLLCILLFLPLSFPKVVAQPARFILLYNDEHKNFAYTVAQQLHDENPLLPLQIQEDTQLASLPADAILITLGKSSLSNTLQSPAYHSQKVIASMISRYDYSQIINRFSPRPATGALFSDPALKHQLMLIEQLVSPVKVAIIYDDNSLYIKQDIAAFQSDTLQISAVYASHHNINRLLADNALINSDFLLASYNPAIYNPQNIKNIIFTLLRRKQGLIGYSSSWVNAGALATTYSDQRNIIKNLAAYLQTVIDRQGRLNGEQYPDDVDIIINKDTARALSITPPDEAIIKKSINHQEER